MPDYDATTLGAHPETASTAGLPAEKLFSTEERALPAFIGRYRILRLLGEGGMGAVYEAEQELPHRRVALKVIRAGYANSEMLRRFENEAQALGRLQHPGIAQIHDAGTADTPHGRQPYIAMELVRGENLLAFASEHHLGTPQRLELFAKICDAVQHAHQRGIIHRDLKPSNILVDESGQPRILDFGIVRLTDSDAQATGRTDAGEIIGTLAYMSPEQVSGDPAEIDTRTDVYSLGVILYQMLAGKGPYAIGKTIHEAAQAIRDQEPERLSQVSRTFRGDVETIVIKALEKDKTRRYATAAELASDVRRFLHDEPIVARPPSATYQLGKFARRNKALVGGVAAVFVVLVLGILVSTREAVRARRAEASAVAINDFLQNDLLAQASASGQAGPHTTVNPDLTVRTALDRAAAHIAGKFDKQPVVEAGIRATIGRAYMDLGQYPQARAQLERAVALDRSSLGAENRKTLQAEDLLAYLAELQGEYDEAESLSKQTLAMEQRVFGRDSADTLDTMNRLAVVLWDQGKYAEAETLDRQLVDLDRQKLGAENPATLAAMNTLGVVYAVENKFTQAEPLLSQVVAVRQRTLGLEHPGTLRTMINLSNVLHGEGKDVQAEAILTQVIDIQRRVLGPEHPNTLGAMNDLGDIYDDEGKAAQAEALFSQTVAIERRTLGPEHPDTILAEGNLADAEANLGKYAEAEALRRHVVAVRQRVLGPDHPRTLRSMNNLAWLLVTDPDPSRRRPAEALQLARTSVKTPPTDPAMETTLGLAEYRNGNWDASVAALQQAMRLDQGEEPADFLVLSMADWQRGDQADAATLFQKGAQGAAAEKQISPAQKMLWAEAATLEGKPGPSSGP
ncbi:MAG TPA: serine/threonine-protein kinase [Acidobacteriaceae bacterium]